MKIAVDLKKSEHDDLLIVEVTVDGKHMSGIKRTWSRDEFHTYFDAMWGSFGKQIKKMSFDLEFER